MGRDALFARWIEGKNRYVGAVSLGHGGDGKRIRRKVSGRAKAEVRQKLKELHSDIDAGLHTPSAGGGLTGSPS